MRLYLDEDIASRHLVQALKKASHDVETPMDVGLMGESDILQLAHAVRNNRVCLTANYRDFKQLHDLVILCAVRIPASSLSVPTMTAVAILNPAKSWPRLGLLKPWLRRCKTI